MKNELNPVKMSQVTKFVERCFKRGSKTSPMRQLKEYSENDEHSESDGLIGTLSDTSGDFPWKVKIHEAYLDIESHYFSGILHYEFIESCEHAIITDTDGCVSHIEPYSIEFIRQTNEEEARKVVLRENGLAFMNKDNVVRILMSAAGEQNSRSAIQRLYDFINRVMATKAWK